MRALAMEYKSMEEEPVEGFRVKLVNDESLFEWEVAIFGPPDTLYQGGYFKVSTGDWGLGCIKPETHDDTICLNEPLIVMYI